MQQGPLGAGMTLRDDGYKKGKHVHTNKPDQFFNPLQNALFKVAKAGNIKSMVEFIEAGADPYMLDEYGRNAVFYATLAASDEVDTLAPLLKKIIAQRGGGYADLEDT